MSSAIVYGDMYRVDGGYTVATLTRGSERSLLVDTLETPAWQQHRLEHPQLDFVKGDFGDPFLMASIRDGFDVGVVFDILLHQPPLLHTLSLMLSKVSRAICIAQPCLKEGDRENQLIYLPGSSDTDLYPLRTSSPEFRVFDVDQVNQSHWIWAMTSSFVRRALAGEGFEIREDRTLEHPMLTEHWVWKGFVAERVRTNELHWSHQRPTAGLYTAPW
jgi:DNA-binding transcriptional LysR family regulator